MKFSASSGHARAWRYYKVRPPAGDAHPARTNAQYSIYDEVHRDYVYTDAWIKHLIKELRDPGTFENVVGHRPISVDGGELSGSRSRERGATQWA